MRVAKQNGRYAYTDEMMRKSLKLKAGSRITLSKWVGRGSEAHMQRIQGKLLGIYRTIFCLTLRVKRGDIGSAF